jgi:hypothetical protein
MVGFLELIDARFCFFANSLGNLQRGNWQTKVVMNGNMVQENWKNTNSLQSILNLKRQN